MAFFVASILLLLRGGKEVLLIHGKIPPSSG